MKQKGIKINKQDLEVMDGKVIISSEELAKAIQNEDIKFRGEEENSASPFFEGIKFF